MSLYAFDFDLDLAIFVLKLDLNMVQMHLCTENEATNSCGSKSYSLNRETNRQTGLKVLLTTYADGDNIGVNEKQVPHRLVRNINYLLNCHLIREPHVLLFYCS